MNRLQQTSFLSENISLKIYKRGLLLRKMIFFFVPGIKQIIANKY